MPVPNMPFIYPRQDDPRAQKVCAYGIIGHNFPCIVHKNADYPYWELSPLQTFPCACGKKLLDPKMLVCTELLVSPVEEKVVALGVGIKNDTVVRGFLGPTRYVPPIEMDGAEISDELDEFNL